ncbi:XRE family transcriptional regulator [Streptomyces sp. NRRL B-24484]|uniref:XRE family transcriptional regulator n=1 Tax=Streptomyces sp. NRRL B-24484 TaxID=1463833 RepID=UPI000693ED72|nr:XRE family transcriptional regulator [Streptomyces sp. NRRL B-24484]
MARKPRPVDPADGPVQAFAFDLRLVRERAGNPTYRVLADRAGFGATTLSDAAGGVRFPSLEVAQAYVGACGGDVTEWTKRWHEVDKRLASDAVAPAPAEPAPASPPAATPAPGDESPAEEGAGAATVSGPAPAAPSTAVVPTDATAAVPAAGDPGGDGADPAPPAPGSGLPVDLAESGPARRWPVGWTTAGTAAVLALTVVLVMVVVRSASSDAKQHEANPAAAVSSSATAASGVGCPAPDGASAALFAGETYNATTRVRAGASLSADVVAQLPSGCRLALTGFCLGDVVVDTTSGSPDVRWFRVASGGYVSSAVVHGNPPAGLRPADCPDGVAPPSSIALAAAAPAGAPGAVELHATGDHVAIVGYAAYLPRSGSAMPQWQQIGFTSEAATGFKLTWRPTPAEGKGEGNGSAVPMVAVACFGGDGATAVADARLIGEPVPSGGLPPADLPEADLARARKAACRYPDQGHG